MFTASMDDVGSVLAEFGVAAKPVSIAELQRYDYTGRNAQGGMVRRIIKAELDGASPVVVRFKNEDDISLESIEAQSAFAQLLFDEDIATPRLYRADGHYAKWYSIGDYNVIATVEQYVDGEIRCVDAQTAEQTGMLLARMHDISERAEFHVRYPVLFDPLGANDLFDFDVITDNAEFLMAVDPAMYKDIIEMHEAYMRELRRGASPSRYAVQGDISDCNTYRAADGTIGVFDFNRCGDNDLFFDAIMQAVFEARLMDYPEIYAADPEPTILPAFLRGYAAHRPFTARQRAVYPYLYSMIDAFWSKDIKWSDTSLANAISTGDKTHARAHLREIARRLIRLPAFPIE